MASYYKEHIINGSQDRVVGGLPEGENIQRNGNTLTTTLCTTCDKRDSEVEEGVVGWGGGRKVGVTLYNNIYILPR